MRIPRFPTGPCALACAAFGLAVALPRTVRAECAVEEGDVDRNGAKDLRLSGDAGAQGAVVELRAGGYAAKIDADGNGAFTDAGDVVKSGADPIETFLFDLGGRDTITVLQTEDLVGTTKNLLVSLGKGANRFTYRSQGFAIRGGSSLTFEIRGGAGADAVTLDFSGSAVDDALVAVRGDLGDGANDARIVGAARTTRSVVDVSLVLGHAGGNPSGAYSDGGGVVSNSTVRVRVVGAESPKVSDVFSTTFSGRIEDNSRVAVNAFLMPGNDTYVGRFDVSTFGIDVAGAPGSEMTVSVMGGVGFDTLKVDDLGAAGAAVINGKLAIDLDGGPQPDVLGVVWRGIAGRGQFRCRVNGGSASDAIDAAVRADPASANSLWFHFGGATEEDISPKAGDALNVTFDAPPSVNYGPLGGVIVDGGLQGDDTCNVTGTAKHVVIHCEKGSWRGK